MFVMLCSLSCSQAHHEETQTYKPNTNLAFFKGTSHAILQDLQQLSSDEYSGRKTGSKESVLAQAFIINHLRSHQVPPLFSDYKQPFIHTRMFGKTSGVNIAAVVEGTEHKSKYIVLTAHYDHLGKNIEGVFNGADDNASGVVALLHYAKHIKQYPLKHSIIFLFTDAEEEGLVGAKEFIEQNANLLPNIQLNINIDMIGGAASTKNLNYLAYRLFEHDLPRKKAWLAINNSTPLIIKKGFSSSDLHAGESKNYWIYVSDHGAFFQHNIPCIYFGVNPHKNYHETTDNFQHINKAFYLKAINTIYLHLRHLDSMI